MEKKKMTRKEYLEQLKEIEAVKSNAELVAFLDRQIELASRKSTRTRTKTQIENEKLVEDIYDYMVEAGGTVTIADLMGKFEISNQKASALLKKLVDTNRAERAKDGKKRIYSVIEGR